MSTWNATRSCRRWITGIALAACMQSAFAGLSFDKPYDASGNALDAESSQTDANFSATQTQSLGRARLKGAVDETLELGQGQFDLTAPLRIGIQKPGDYLFDTEVVEKTKQMLFRLFGTRNVVFEYVATSDVGSELSSNRLDFILTDADTFSRHETLESLKAIASIWTVRASDPVETVGAVYFTRPSNRFINTPDDMIQKRIAATDPRAFGGYLVAQRDMFQRGYVPEVVMANTTFYGNQPHKIIEAVLSGEQDVGILPACTLEYLAYKEGFDISTLKLLGLRKDGLLRCSYSTSLYPLGYFAATYGTDPVLTKVVSAGLFTMEAMQNGTEWSLPVSNRAVHDLFFDLKIGPYEHLGRWNFVRFVRDNAKTFVGICLAAFFVFAYTISLSILVRRRTNMLCQALEERDSIEAMVKASRDHINNLERTGIVGQMSTMIAHELKQPLGAITNFANGMLRRVKRGNIDEATLTQVLEEIVEQGTRASEIVNRVRAYAKHQTPELRLEDMSLAIEKAIETFKRSRRTSSEISTIIPPYLWAEIDAWELELAVLNLLKNAADSLVGVEDAQIEVYVHPEDRFWRIEVSDNGAPITQDQVDKFMQPLVTSKKHGLGLGLSIVGNIVERHHGRLSGVANTDRGVTMIVDIPRKNADADQNSPQNETKLENFSA